jgi:hypothetical protein
MRGYASEVNLALAKAFFAQQERISELARKLEGKK